MNPTVLVVDDEDALRVMLAANLELEGFTTLEAQNAEEALVVLSQRRVDLVLTDIRMPGKDGVTFFRQLRSDGMKVPVVLMTGFAMESLIQAALEEGVFAVLPKPFDVGHAVSVVTAAIRRPAVLVVDDSAEIAARTQTGLEAAGVRAVAVKSPGEALNAFTTGGIDLVVVDLVMPTMNGVTLSERLRSLDPRVALIAMSGDEDPELLRDVSRVGIETFLRKPFRMRELLKSIAVARGRRRMLP